MAKTNGDGKRAAAYLRCSTDQQPQSIADQRQEIERVAASRGYSIVKEYVDDGVSGTSIDGRAGFQLLIKDGTRADRPFDDVFVYDVKRFSRGDADETGYYRHLLRQSGVDIIYVAESFSGNDTDDIVRSVKQYLARQESKDLSKVTIRGQVSAAKKGWWTGGAPPWGYDLAYLDSNGKLINKVRYMENGESELLDPDGKLTRTLARKERRGKSDGEIVKLVPSAPDRVRLIQRIFHMYLVDRLGYKSIADKLNGEGIPSPRNGNYASNAQKGWAGSTIKGILDNPNYVGDLVWNRRTGAKFYRIAGERAVERGQILSATFQPNDESDYVVYPNAHPAIIEREILEATRRLQESRRLHHQGPPYQTGKAKDPRTY